ncbi:unnamed protein product, partial [Ectocarpus sp. 13 AM-2016]
RSRLIALRSCSVRRGTCSTFSGRWFPSNTPTPWTASLASRRSSRTTASTSRTTWSLSATSSDTACLPQLTRRPQ